MSAGRKAWIVAASIGAVEALKDQGICRWNYTFRSIQQHLKSNLRSFVQANFIKSSAASGSQCEGNNGITKAYTMDKVLSFNCWGPTTVRF